MIIEFIIIILTFFNISVMLKLFSNLIIFINKSTDVTIIAITEANAIPIIPIYLDKVMLNIMLITTPIIPFIAVTFVFPLENKVEFNISLTPVKNIPAPYPSNASVVIFIA